MPSLHPSGNVDDSKRVRYLRTMCPILAREMAVLSSAPLLSAPLSSSELVWTHGEAWWIRIGPGPRIEPLTGPAPLRLSQRFDDLDSKVFDSSTQLSGADSVVFSRRVGRFGDRPPSWRTSVRDRMNGDDPSRPPTSRRITKQTKDDFARLSRFAIGMASVRTELPLTAAPKTIASSYLDEPSWKLRTI